MQVWCDWQVTLCDPHLSALEERFSRRCAIQIDVYLYLYLYLYFHVSYFIHSYDRLRHIILILAIILRNMHIIK